MQVTPQLTSGRDVIRQIAGAEGGFVAWVGAGISRDSGILVGQEICLDIKTKLTEGMTPPEADAWAKSNLDWDDPRRRYTSCINQYGVQRARIRYVRDIVRDRKPSFSHHAIALLMQHGCISSNCLTTNFDKLLEMAFAQHAVSDYQAIRSDDETRFHGQEDKFHIIKLHGDYDTENIMNTKDETIFIADQMVEKSTDVLRRQGLFVLGSSGYEQSVVSFLDGLWKNSDKTVLDGGIYWGVYVGDQRERGLSHEEEMKRLLASIEQGNVSRELCECAERARKSGREFIFFPVWGAAQFLFDLIRAIGKPALTGEARRYLDHAMRLRDVLSRGGLNHDAIDLRSKNVTRRGHGLRVTPQAIFATRWIDPAGNQVNLVYGDLSSRSLLSTPRMPEGLRRAVVSPDDVYLSAGGGASLALLEKAGQELVLNEFSKFSEVRKTDVVVTSGFNLPVNYIFHAATVALNADGSSSTTADDVQATMSSVLRAARATWVNILFVPLIGAGTEAVKPDRSLAAILTAVAEFLRNAPDHRLCVVLVLRDEASLGRDAVGKIVESCLPEFKT